MDTLSRREEETLLKTTKARALKECDDVVKGTGHLVLSITTDSMNSIAAFAECSSGRTVSVVWACRDQHKLVQQCMLQ